MYNSGQNDGANSVTVWLDYSYDPDGYVDGVRAHASNGNTSGWFWIQ